MAIIRRHDSNPQGHGDGPRDGQDGGDEGDELNGKGLRRWLRSQFEPEVVRRRTHRGAIVAIGLFLVVVAVVLVRPGIYVVGPLVIGLDSLRNPLLELGAAILVTLATRKRTFQRRFEVPHRFRAYWSGWTTGGRIFAVVLTAKTLMTGVNLVRLPSLCYPFDRSARTGIEEPIEDVFASEDRYAQFERFFEKCRQELPADARVLYIGRSEGQLLAYILYPRPVFMHPTDRYVAWIGHQVLDLGVPLPDDELFPGSLPPPLEAPSLADFIEVHRITHEVRFVESDLPACRIRAIR